MRFFFMFGLIGISVFLLEKYVPDFPMWCHFFLGGINYAIACWLEKGLERRS